VEAEPFIQRRSLIIIGLLHAMVMQQGVLFHPLNTLLERAVVHESVLPLGDKLPFELLGELHHGVRLRRTTKPAATAMEQRAWGSKQLLLMRVGMGGGAVEMRLYRPLEGKGIASQVRVNSTFRDILRSK
jgi:hypothetical protein